MFCSFHIVWFYSSLFLLLLFMTFGTAFDFLTLGRFNPRICFFGILFFCRHNRLYRVCTQCAMQQSLFRIACNQDKSPEDIANTKTVEFSLKTHIVLPKQEIMLDHFFLFLLHFFLLLAQNVRCSNLYSTFKPGQISPRVPQ